MVRRAARLWPANREARFAFSWQRLEASLGFADANHRDYCKYVEPLAEPHTELRSANKLNDAAGLDKSKRVELLEAGRSSTLLRFRGYQAMARAAPGGT